MKAITIITCNFICLLLIAFLTNGCSSALQKPQVYTVEIKDMKFVPQNITVHKGDTVIWINRDIMVHDVTEETSNAWSSLAIPSGGSWKMAVTDEASYYCSIHVIMKGKLIIE